ncbi:MAG: pyridoxal-phosphate dependent enzyme, partial [Oscillospiraceae bacterium]|nr:pyridoxal-phosphate dependent enzyme [Oscillospiraceae bacterium]
MKLREIMNNIPRERLAPLPTPIQQLSNTEKLVGAKDKMYIKRDDLTGIGSGGNKVRCMEYILGRAKAGGYDGVLASGNGQSNLCSLAAASAARAGLKCYIVHNSDKPQQSVGNALLNDLLGVEREYMGACDSSIREKYVYDVIGRLAEKGEKYFLIRNGATTGHGALGYVNAIIELMDQCEKEGLEIKHIFAPGGNGGIATGLIYGNALMGFPFTVHIISVEDTKPVLVQHIENTIKEIEEITGLPFEYEVGKAADIVDKYMGEGWSCNTPESENEVL